MIDQIRQRTQLLNLEAYTNLNHLYAHRNFAAHPALNDEYELISPSEETTIAHIKNILNDILVKPPIFIKNIIDLLTEELKEIKDIYKGEREKLRNYLNNKYFNKMSLPMIKSTFKVLWKLCFICKDNEDCKNNIVINRKAMEIMYEGHEKELFAYLKDNSNFLLVASDDWCMANLIIFLAVNPPVYSLLNDDTKLHLEVLTKKHVYVELISWFKQTNKKEHLKFLMTKNDIGDIPKNWLEFAFQKYSDEGISHLFIDFLIKYFSNSYNYKSAINRYEEAIQPYLAQMKYKQFSNLIQVINENRQIYERSGAYSSNNEIVMLSKDKLGPDFDYSKFDNFKFDKTILNENEEELDITVDDESFDTEQLPF